MTVKNVVKRVGAAVAVSAVAAGGLLAMAAPASAATSGALEVCSKGNYASYVEFPEEGTTSFLVHPGECTKVSEFPNPNKLVPINVYGIHNPSMFWMQHAQFSPSFGGTVETYGSSANPSATVPALPALPGRPLS